MLQTLVSGQIAFLTEAHAALLAGVRFLGGVRALVSGEMILHAERSAAHVAAVILLARVDGQVAEQLLPPSEHLLAVFALVRVRFRVGSAVYVERRFRLEGFAAGVAHERTLAGVNRPSMVLHCRLHGERPAAYVARVVLHASVNVLQMVVETASLAELFAAYVTGV